MKGIAFATLAAIAIGVAVTKYDSSTNSSGTAEFDAKIRVKEDCLGWAAERLSRCSSPSCTNLVTVRLPRCFDYADGDKKAFCNSIEKQFWKGPDDQFIAAHCAPHDAATHNCKKVLNVANTYCVTGG